MDRDVLRLELLKLAMPRIPDHQECMARVGELENWVLAANKPLDTADKRPADSRKGRLAGPAKGMNGPAIKG